MSTANTGTRLVFVDALKAIASQLIVLHHLAFYGPMSDYAQPLAPKLMCWLSQYARIAVQVFLVVGGYLAAQALARNGTLTDRPLRTLLWRRYRKLVLPYFGALLFAIACAAFARSLIENKSIPDAPALWQIFAHLFLLQGVLGFDGLSAGAWYIAIDFQLYALLLATLWSARRGLPNVPSAGRILVTVLLLASVFYFNRDSTWDNWAIYFFGAYGLGAIVYWNVGQGKAAPWLGILLVLIIAALLIDFRLRIALALCVALALGLARYAGFIERWPDAQIFAWIGKNSYAIFLVHFPVCLVINALFERFVPHEPALQLFGMFAAWVGSIGVGALFQQQVECRSQRWLA